MTFYAFFAFFFLLSSILALPVRRDVWVPPITNPTNATIVAAGGLLNVTWDTSSQPAQVTNTLGQIYLRVNDSTQSTPLAQGFPLDAGWYEVTIPADTQPANNWTIVLFGDSGNWSPFFTITPAISS